MFSSKSPKSPAADASRSPRVSPEHICMVECGCAERRSSSVHGSVCAPPQQLIGVVSEKKGLDNLAYEYGSQSDLKTSTETFKLLGLDQQQPIHAVVESRISRPSGVPAVRSASPSRPTEVDYVSSLVTGAEMALELRRMGFDVESTARIGVDGMRCQSCVQSIQRHVGALRGVSHVHVSLQEGAALVVFQPLHVSRQELRDKIEDLGFGATLLDDDASSADIRQADSRQTVSVWIAGMTCSSCVRSIEGRVSQMTGVHSILVSLKDEKGTISFEPALTEPELLRAAIEDMGFDASLQEPAASAARIQEEPLSCGPADRSCKRELDNGVGFLSSSACQRASAKVQKCFVGVTGMTCASCVASIERNLLKHEGVVSVLVSLMAGKAEVKYDPDVTDAAAVTQLIEDLGFGANLMEDDAVPHGKLDLTISGMTCASCTHNIESKLAATKGIVAASVALATKTAHIQFDPDTLGARDIIKIIQVNLVGFCAYDRDDNKAGGGLPVEPWL